MKPIVQMARCENCNTIIELVTPPSRDQYKLGRIHITEGIVLLDRTKANVGPSAFFSGYYCSPTCLSDAIATLRRSA